MTENKKRILEAREKAIITNFTKVSKQLGIINENGRYDLVSQFNGNHHGSPMAKNSFLNNLGLDESGIKTLNVLLNLISGDEHWMSLVYPNGASSVDVIVDITNFFDNNQAAMDLIAQKNPVQYANKLKSAIAKKKGVDI